MTELQRLAAAEAGLKVRPATSGDRAAISDLISHESHVHRHLDWRAPLDWLGCEPFWLLQEGDRILGALACPPDPKMIAWIRLFAFASHVSARTAWRLLWKEARAQLAEGGGATAAAIATQPWLDQILIEGGFEVAGHIVLLEWSEGPRAKPHMPSNVDIRLMTDADLPLVTDVDAAAFEPLWRNSLEALTRAYGQASYATIAQDPAGLIGYQLSTGSPFGTHLARLAVRPGAQRRGVGAALVADLKAHLPSGSEQRITVNTQANNAASLALYHRLGFRRTGERYPVYSSEVR